MFPCLPISGNIVAETKFASQEAKMFPKKFRNTFETMFPSLPVCFQMFPAQETLQRYSYLIMVHKNRGFYAFNVCECVFHKPKCGTNFRLRLQRCSLIDTSLNHIGQKQPSTSRTTSVNQA